jgi:hypothetical protein
LQQSATTTTAGGVYNIFAPPSRTFNNLNAAITNANFVAAD